MRTFWLELSKPFRILYRVSKLALILIVVICVVLNFVVLTIPSVADFASSTLAKIGVNTVLARQKSQSALDLQSAKRASDRDIRLAVQKARREATQEFNERLAEQERLHKTALVKARRDAAEMARQQTLKSVASTRAQVAEIADLTDKRVRSRLTKQAARNTASVFGEGIPIAGIGVIAASLAYDVKDMCSTAKDMTGLIAAVETPDDPEGARATAEANFDCKELIPNLDDLPSGQDIRNKVTNAPENAWRQAQELYAGASDIKWSWEAAKTNMKSDAVALGGFFRDLFLFGD